MKPARRRLFDDFRPPSTAQLTQSTPPFCKISPKRVLFLDDEVVLTTLMQAIARRYCMEVTIAHTVAEARLISASAPQAFDLYVLDIVLANGSGIEFYAELKARWPRVEVVFLTGNDSEERRARIEDIGPARVYAKSRAMTIHFLESLFAQLGFIKIHPS